MLRGPAGAPGRAAGRGAGPGSCQAGRGAGPGSVIEETVKLRLAVRMIRILSVGPHVVFGAGPPGRTPFRLGLVRGHLSKSSMLTGSLAEFL